MMTKKPLAIMAALAAASVCSYAQDQITAGGVPTLSGLGPPPASCSGNDARAEMSTGEFRTL
jgi:hypothetical protein